MSRYLWFLSFFFLLGCKSNSDTKLIPQMKMTTVLWDMIQIDELAASRLARDTGRDEKKERILLYQKVFDIHQVSKKQFYNSYKYYAFHPDKLKVLFDILEARGIRGRMEQTKITLKKDSLPK